MRCERQGVRFLRCVLGFTAAWIATVAGTSLADDALIRRIEKEAPPIWRARQQEAFPIRGGLRHETRVRDGAIGEFRLQRSTDFSIRVLDESTWFVCREGGMSRLEKGLTKDQKERIVCCRNATYVFTTVNGVLSDFEPSRPTADVLTLPDPAPAENLRHRLWPVVTGAWRLYGVHSLAIAIETKRLKIRTAEPLAGANAGKLKLTFEFDREFEPRFPQGIIIAVIDPSNGWGFEQYEAEVAGARAVHSLRYADAPLPGRKWRHLVKVSSHCSSLDPDDPAASIFSMELTDIHGDGVLPSDFRLPAFGLPERAP